MDSLRKRCTIDSVDMSEQPPVVYAIDCFDGLHEVPYYLGNYELLPIIRNAQQEKIPLMLVFDGYAPYSTIVNVV